MTADKSEITGGTQRAIMLSECAASVRSYAAMARHATVVLDAGETALKARRTHHRYTIDGPNGAVLLTVPIEKDWRNPLTTIKDVRIAEQPQWRRLHWGALYSSYGKTPYFDFIAHELHHIIVDTRQTFLLDFNLAMHSLIVDFMGLEIETQVVEAGGTLPAGCTDLRPGQRHRTGDTLPVNDIAYRQQWSDRTGFKPALSILDLFMNLGREGVLVAAKM